MKSLRTGMLMLLGLVAACSTPKPERFHSLLPAERPASRTVADPIYVDVAPVKVPAQVDHAQWVLRQPDDSLLLLEQERWAAPLADELRAALVDGLIARWSTIDVRGVALPAPAVWRVSVDVQRFESVSGREARLEAAWSVSAAQRGTTALVCRSTLVEPVGEPGVPALAAAHRRTAARLADEIGRRLQALRSGQPGTC
ncbi:MAG TPA: PqiC family protein [Albitalea sp.]|uniref:PqiC family protein n=1 Tax=Piscinibacter sp. TaxID=1903157 RepID=UPI002ED23F74